MKAEVTHHKNARKGAKDAPCRPLAARRGVLEGNERGFAFIKPADGGEDYFVPAKYLKGAYHGDEVLFSPVRGTADRAEILGIAARNPSPAVGTVVFEKRYALLYPDDRRRPVLYIPRDGLGGAQNGQKAVCRITSYPKGRPPVASVEEILGEEGELAAEELSIVRAYGLREEFPVDVLKEAAELSREKTETAGRRDLRDRTVFTIDCEDTRDMDDAVSLERRDGKFILGVHIADVTHYVEPHSPTDREAYSRGTSVYFPDRAIPMLPEALSNGICSLNEGEDRYCLTCELTFGGGGERLGCEFYGSVIKSRRKTSYKDVAAVLAGDVRAREKYADIAGVLDDMYELCRLLKKRRSEAGSIDFDVREPEILFKDGKVDIPVRERLCSEELIEQFMIAANEAAALFLIKRGAHCLYRVHERPTAEKCAAFAAFMRDLGIEVKLDCDDPQPADFKRALERAQDKPCAAVANRFTLRSMQKARYSPACEGHFGLALSHYCHFTSPIRRYPDITVHRAIKDILSGKGCGQDKDFIKEAAERCSAAERNAEAAERAVDDLYVLAYMNDRIGEEACGTVSGVTAHGIYVELDNAAEGLVPAEDLPDGEYTFYEDKMLLSGKRRSFRPGQRVKVMIASCDLGRMKALLKLL